MLRLVLGSGRRSIQTQQEAGGRHGSEDVYSESGSSITDVASNPTHDINIDAEMIEVADETNDMLEPWVDWIKRVTHNVEHYLQKLDIDSWVVKVRRGQWRLAATVASLPRERWSKRASEWDPILYFDGGRPKAKRAQARPKKRWADDIQSFICSLNEEAFDNWSRIADMSDRLDDLEEKYLKHSSFVFADQC